MDTYIILPLRTCVNPVRLLCHWSVVEVLTCVIVHDQLGCIWFGYVIFCSCLFVVNQIFFGMREDNAEDVVVAIGHRAL